MASVATSNKVTVEQRSLRKRKTITYDERSPKKTRLRTEPSIPSSSTSISARKSSRANKVREPEHGNEDVQDIHELAMKHNRAFPIPSHGTDITKLAAQDTASSLKGNIEQRPSIPTSLPSFTHDIPMDFQAETVAESKLVAKTKASSAKRVRPSNNLQDAAAAEGIINTRAVQGKVKWTFVASPQPPSEPMVDDTLHPKEWFHNKDDLLEVFPELSVDHGASIDQFQTSTVVLDHESPFRVTSEGTYITLTAVAQFKQQAARKGGSAAAHANKESALPQVTLSQKETLEGHATLSTSQAAPSLYQQQSFQSSLSFQHRSTATQASAPFPATAQPISAQGMCAPSISYNLSRTSDPRRVAHGFPSSAETVAVQSDNSAVSTPSVMVNGMIPSFPNTFATAGPFPTLAYPVPADFIWSVKPFKTSGRYPTSHPQSSLSGVSLQDYLSSTSSETKPFFQSSAPSPVAPLIKEETGSRPKSVFRVIKKSHSMSAAPIVKRSIADPSNEVSVSTPMDVDPPATAVPSALSAPLAPSTFVPFSKQQALGVPMFLPDTWPMVQGNNGFSNIDPPATAGSSVLNAPSTSSMVAPFSGRQGLSTSMSLTDTWPMVQDNHGSIDIESLTAFPSDFDVPIPDMVTIPNQEAEESTSKLPELIPPAVQALINSYTAYAPVKLVASCSAMSSVCGIGPTEERGYSILGCFDIVNVEENLSQPNEVTWSFVLRWGPGGHYTSDESHSEDFSSHEPWWRKFSSASSIADQQASDTLCACVSPLPPTTTSPTENNHYYQCRLDNPSYPVLNRMCMLNRAPMLLPMHLFDSPADTGMWHCQTCGKVNIQDHLFAGSAKPCSSSNCSPFIIPEDIRVLELKEVQTNRNSRLLPITTFQYPEPRIDSNGMRVFTMKAGRTGVLHHIFTCNSPELQIPQTQLFLEWQTGVTMRRKNRTSQYYIPEADDVSKLPCMEKARMALSRLVQDHVPASFITDAPEEGYKIVDAVGWSSAGSQRADPFHVSSKTASTAIMLLGEDVTLKLSLSKKTSASKDSSKDPQAWSHTLGHGDVLVISGEDFQMGIKRQGTSILLIGCM